MASQQGQIHSSGTRSRNLAVGH
eukprot:COSAG06_NODE_56411_length_284_cov_6664.497297_1_plen_22_part_01